MKKTILANLRNIPGWSTRRKIVVFESDDWGSIRMSSAESLRKLQEIGFDFTGQSFNLYDSIESNDDLIGLYEVLSSHKDSKGNSPVFTAVSIVGNPDFDKIKENGYREYFWESFTETLKRYPAHDKVYELYKEGIKRRLFYPIFHGREHLNAQRWLRLLSSGNKTILRAFDYRVTGVSIGFDGKFIGDMQAAFDLDSAADLPFMRTLIADGLDEFEKLWGFRARYFVATNGPFNNSLEVDLKSGGVDYILGERLQKEPLGEGKYKTHLHYIGQKNKLGQTYLTRNGFFEPSISKDGFDVNPIEKCIKYIEDAFRWGKPAVISTHRLNYIGFIDPLNRERNLELLNKLFTKISQRWPEVEYMTSVELGDLIIKR